MTENRLISERQFGFMKHRSASDLHLLMSSKWAKALDSGLQTLVIALDIEGAFDRVWHKGLLAKLEAFGISGKLLAILGDYLQDRSLQVTVNGSTSRAYPIAAGVPQGSVLGPLLFLLFIDDIVHVVRHCNIRLFADDTCLFIEVEDTEDREAAARLIDEDLASIAGWSDQWLVKFSPAKTKALVISNKHDAECNPPVHLMNREIEEVTSHAYLGLHIASNLSWKPHVEEVAVRARKKLNLMQPLKFKVDRRSLEIMYRSFVLPSMDYAIAVWGGSYDNSLDKLERIHVDAKRLITGATARSSITNLDRELPMQSIQERIEVASLSVLFKIIHGDAPAYLTDILNE